MPPTLAGTPTPLTGGGATSTTTGVAGATGTGASSMPPVPTNVAGATGGGGLESLSPLLQQVAAAVQALTAALGSQALGGGGATAGAATCQMPGMEDAIGGGPGQIGQEPPMPTDVPVPTDVPAPPAGDKSKGDKNGNGKGGDAGPEPTGKGKGKGKKDGAGKGGDSGPEQRGGPDRPKRNKPQKPDGGGNGGGIGGADGAPPPPPPGPPKDPNGPRRRELRQDIREAKAELKRISDKIDTLAAERERLESSTSTGSTTAAEHKMERLNEIRAEINALRSAGGYISSSLPIMQAELDELPPPPK